MAKPTSRQTLIDYCLRALGHPVIEINVDDDQLEDRIDAALQFYQEYHSDAVVRNLRKHLITTDDVTNGYITIPNNAGILSINNIIPVSSLGSMSNQFSIAYQLKLNSLYDLSAGSGLVNYEMTKQYMSLIDRNISGVYEQIEFSRHKNRLIFHTPVLDKLVAGQYLLMDGYEVIDPDTYTDVYNDRFLKKYATALIKKQWGQNLSKFEGMQLPGGVTINGRAILEDAVAEIDKIEEQMQLTYENPPMFFVG